MLIRLISGDRSVAAKYEVLRQLMCNLCAIWAFAPMSQWLKTADACFARYSHAASTRWSGSRGVSKGSWYDDEAGAYLEESQLVSRAAQS